jgi:beta-lactamase class A
VNAAPTPGAALRWLLLLLVLAALALASCRAEPSPEPGRVRVEGGAGSATAQRLARRVEELLRGQDGHYGLVLEHVERGERVALDDRRSFAAASTYKLALAYEVLREVRDGRLQLDRRLTIGDDDAVEPEPAGGLAVGEEVTVRRALEATMSVSSNAAGHALLRLVGRGQLNSSLANLGLADTRVPPDAGPFALWRNVVGPPIAVTTPADMARLLRLLARGELLDRAGQAELRRLLRLREALDPLASALPPDTVVLAKVGNLEAVSNVAGLIETPAGALVVTIYSQDVDPDAARRLCGQLGRALYDFYTG